MWVVSRMGFREMIQDENIGVVVLCLQAPKNQTTTGPESPDKRLIQTLERPSRTVYKILRKPQRPYIKWLTLYHSAT